MSAIVLARCAPRKPHRSVGWPFYPPRKVPRQRRRFGYEGVTLCTLWRALMGRTIRVTGRASTGNNNGGNNNRVGVGFIKTHSDPIISAATAAPAPSDPSPIACSPSPAPCCKTGPSSIQTTRDKTKPPKHRGVTAPMPSPLTNGGESPPSPRAVLNRKDHMVHTAIKSFVSDMQGLQTLTGTPRPHSLNNRRRPPRSFQH